MCAFVQTYSDSTHVWKKVPKFPRIFPRRCENEEKVVQKNITAKTNRNSRPSPKDERRNIQLTNLQRREEEQLYVVGCERSVRHLQMWAYNLLTHTLNHLLNDNYKERGQSHMKTSATTTAITRE